MGKGASGFHGVPAGQWVRWFPLVPSLGKVRVDQHLRWFPRENACTAVLVGSLAKNV